MVKEREGPPEFAPWSENSRNFKTLTFSIFSQCRRNVLFSHFFFSPQHIAPYSRTECVDIDAGDDQSLLFGRDIHQVTGQREKRLFSRYPKTQLDGKSESPLSLTPIYFSNGAESS